MTRVPHRVDVKSYDTVIIGAGFAGLGAAIRLSRAGVDDLLVLERGDSVGGTWRDNTYPGAACDIPSLLYSYSFAQNPRWSRGYSSSAEILAYIESMVARYDLGRFIRFGQDVTGLTFDERRGVWTLTTAGRRRYDARTVVMASGPLANASLPDIRGLDSYRGHKIHSARWDHDYDMAGKRVAVIGTGASAVQIVPELVNQAATVKVFQRTPGWVLPRLDFRTPTAAKALFRAVPSSQDAARTALFYGHEAVALGLVWDTPITSLVEGAARAHLHRQVRDPWLRRQLTPDFRAGCKRMLVSSDFYPALQRDNCKLVTWPIATISPDGIRTSDGIEHQVDCIVFATGFDVCKTGTPFPITGVGGRSLSDEWTDGAYAYKSASVHGYPNLFLTFGPNSGPGHNSALVYMQAQLDYAVRGITTILEQDLRSLDVRYDVQRRYNNRIQRRLRRTTWNSGCSSWYLTADGFNPSMYPGFATQYLRQMKTLRLADYTLIERSTAASDRRRDAVA
jgi:cation diffusion facilitator CzcD-associated flavoprotein CzcO